MLLGFCFMHARGEKSGFSIECHRFETTGQSNLVRSLRILTFAFYHLTFYFLPMLLTPARIDLDLRRTIAPISPLLFGGFAEHLGRCVYEGMYDPGSPLADKNGFRTDVLAALRDEMKISILRYPGGNFVSAYNWRDGVGPADQRPTRMEPAWRSLESNRVGTNEFIQYCKALGALPMLGLN